MRHEVWLSLILAVTISSSAFAQSNDDDLCKRSNQTVALMKSKKNDGSSSYGVIFPFMTKLLNGFKDDGQSGLNLKSGQVGSKNDSDLFVADSGGLKFFARNEAPPYPDKDTHAGIIPLDEVSASDAAESGIICPETGYLPHWTKENVSKNNLYCVRALDGKTYAVIQVKAVCSDSIVFNWSYQPSGSRIFSPGNTPVPLTSNPTADVKTATR